MTNPYAGTDSETLAAMKDDLVRELLHRLVALKMEPDYAVAVMRAARGLAAADRIEILESLVEIEAIKYTLAARRVRELDPDETR
jgi:hypothetical protein